MVDRAIVGPPLFDLKKISFSYGDKKAIDDLSISLEPGKLYGILGPNGSGKTTLLDLLLGERTPDSGDINFKGKHIDTYGKGPLSREIALVPQEFQINFSFTVGEVVMMGRHPYLARFGAPLKNDYNVVQKAMHSLDIDSLAQRFVTTLSGGEKQRVVAARALAQQAPVMLLDEATSNLDIKHTLTILNAVRDLVRKEGRTVIAVLHNLNLAGAYCDELIFLKQGKIHVMGDTAQTLLPANIKEVFEVDCQVGVDGFSGVPQVHYRYN